MRVGIAPRLALLLALVGALAAGATGWYVYRASSELVVSAAQSRLLTATQVVKRRIMSTREFVSRDLQVLATHPAAVRALSGPDPQARSELLTLFQLRMLVSPAYLQLRLISADDFGAEVVRLDRDVTGPLPVPDDDLQEKGHFAYVSQALTLQAGQTFVSDIVINRESGAHLSEGKPSLVMSMPVMGAAGRVVGVMAINLDVQGMFDLLAQDLPPEFQLYLANGVGDILIHPDAGLTFGFDRGQRQLVQDHMPPTRPLVERLKEEVVFDLPAGPHAREPLVAAFVRQSIQVVSDEQQLLLGLAQPLRLVLAEVEQLRLTIVHIVAVLGLVWLVVAVVLARALSRPINEIGQAARLFAQGEVAHRLPTERNDEVGDLARSFERMQSQITQQLHELERSRRELSDQARHDGLTGLANRRLFGERLQAALAHRRRHGGEVALLLLDLDRFKPINDTHGHDAGDAVLKAVSQRLRDNVREVDTAARLGGDEFVVLLSGVSNVADLAPFALKLLERVSEPIAHGNLMLQVGCSLGISRTPVDGDTPDTLLLAADAAMYEAKDSGRHSVRWATPVAPMPQPRRVDEAADQVVDRVIDQTSDQA